MDAGTEQCPCHLALTGDCLICSRLQGRDTCDCPWEGTCPYTVFLQNGREVSPFRRERTAALVERKEYNEGITVLVLDVGRGFAQKASLPGSFVFLRRAEEEAQDTAVGAAHYDMPVSVLRADETRGQIHLAIRREGTKSKRILEDNSRYVLRGPYRSGLRGAGYLKSGYLKGKKLLFLTRGIGAVPALLVMDGLMTMNDSGTLDRVQIRWLADDTKVDQNLLEEYGCVERERREARLPEVLKEGQFDVVMIGASDYHGKRLAEIVREVLPEAKLVTANNAKMCCGEGICGACTEVLPDGSVVRWCKCGK